MKRIMIIAISILLIISFVGCKSISLENFGFGDSSFQEESQKKGKPKKKIIRNHIVIKGTISPEKAKELYDKYGVEVDPDIIEKDTVTQNNSNVTNYEIQAMEDENNTENSSEDAAQINQHNNNQEETDTKTSITEKEQEPDEEEKRKQEEEKRKQEEEKRKEEKESEIENENKRHSDAIENIKSNYAVEIRVLKSNIDMYYDLMTGSYNENKLNMLYEQVAQKERKLGLLQMGSGSKVEIQKVQNEISSLRQQIAQMEADKIWGEEIEKAESKISQLESKMSSEIFEENNKHKQNLQDIENKY